MLFKLGFLAVTHLFLTALAEDKNCYKGGVKVSTLGDDIDLRDAFNSICDRIGGKVYQLGQKVSDQSRTFEENRQSPDDSNTNSSFSN